MATPLFYQPTLPGEDGLAWFEKNPDLPVVPLQWAVELAGMTHRQLRNAIDRGILEVGRQSPNKRWVFTYRETYQLQIIADIMRRTLTPITPAIEISKRLDFLFEERVEEVRQIMADAKSGINRIPIKLVCHFDDNENPVCFWSHPNFGIVPYDGENTTKLNPWRPTMEICPAEYLVQLLAYHAKQERENKKATVDAKRTGA